MVEEETKEVEGVEFKLKRELKKGKIIKHIEFETKNQSFSYSERVQAIKLEDFEELFSHTNMKIITTFGNHSLEGFDKEKSDRLIIIAQK